MILTEFPYVLG